MKRLTRTRCESGVMAAMLARDGFVAPATFLEGEFGYLNVFCRDGDANRLTAGLGEVWKTTRIMFKRYSCHITAHVPVTAILRLKSHFGFAGDEVEDVTVRAAKNAKSP